MKFDFIFISPLSPAINSVIFFISIILLLSESSVVFILIVSFEFLLFIIILVLIILTLFSLIDKFSAFLHFFEKFSIIFSIVGNSFLILFPSKLLSLSLLLSNISES